jgi:rhamnosyltransferase
MQGCSSPSVGVIIPTWQARNHLSQCLAPILLSPLKPKVLVIDSSSTDGTAAFARELGVETLEIPQNQFNHGHTRELARKHINTDIVVMMTQDCYAENSTMLGRLIEPLLKGQASISYARQRPHIKAGFFETFSREFNYPADSHTRDISGIKQWGIYTYFCSNSCAAYSNSALNDIGGFSSTLLGEDTVATAKLLHQGHKIAYVADAIVRHSHDYSLLEEFRRSFDTGYARRSYADLLKGLNGDTHRGLAYTLELTKRLCKEKPTLLPYAAIQTTMKWFGYQFGKHGHRLPHWMKCKLSNHKSFWKQL